MQVPNFKSFRLKCLALVLIVFASACENQSIRDVLESENRDLSSGGLVNVERKSNGTVKLIFRGVVGSDSYELFEATKEKGIAEADLPSAKALNERLLTVVQHAPGKLVYEFESAHIPLGGQFCYRLSSTEKSTGKKFDLGSNKCLINDQNWLWNGIRSANADELGRIVLKWDRLPVDGTTYEVFRRFPDKENEYSESPFNTILAGASAMDEVLEDRFPRCYLVRIRHTLFVNLDKNSNEVCLTETEYLNQKMTTKDIEAPVFAGIKTIEAVKLSSILSQISTSVGLSSGINVMITWEQAQDNLTRASRIKYKVYRAETSFGFDLEKPLFTTASGQLNYTDKSITKGALYYYLVRAEDEQGNVDQNVNQKILPLDLTPPVFSGVETGVTMRNNSSIKVLLSWNSASDDQTPAQGIVYQIFRSQSEGFFPESPIGTVVGTTWFDDTSAEKGQIYFYKVHALDKESNRDGNSKAITVNTGETPPVFPGLTSAVLSGGVGELRWEPAVDDETPSGAIKYRVYRREEGGVFKYANRDYDYQTEPGQLQYSDRSVDPNKSYYYVVRAMDEQGFEDQNTKVVFMPANQPPRMTVAPAVTWDKVKSCIKVAWQAATDDSSPASQLTYKIYRSEQPVLSSFKLDQAPLFDLPGGTKEYSDCEADKLKSYSYIIRAVDSDKAEGGASPIGTILANQPPTPGTVTKVSIVNSTGVELQWNRASDDRSAPEDIRYVIYRFPKWTGTGAPKRESSAYAASNQIGSVDPGKTTFVDDKGVNPSVEYSWLIRPIDSFGVEGINTEDEVSLSANLPPDFGGLSLVALSGLRGVNLTWSLAKDDRTPDNQLTYKIYYMEVPANTPTGEDPNFPIANELLVQLFVESNIKQSVTGTSSTLTLQVPDSNRAYLFGVRACDSLGTCENNTKAFATPANRAPQFDGLQSAVEATSGVNLTWLAAIDERDNSAELMYRVYRLVTDKATVTAAEVLSAGVYRTTPAGVTLFTDDALVSASYNHYLVRSLDKSLAEDSNTVVKSILPDKIPPVFFGIKTATMNMSRITLTWDAAQDNRTQSTRIKYRVYESRLSNYQEIVSTPPIMELTNGQQVFSRDPPTGHKYYYVVRAFDEAGNKDNNEVVKNTEDVIPPVFGGLITGYAVTNSGVQLFWTDTPNSDIDQVKIYRADNLSEPVAAVYPNSFGGGWKNSYLVTDLTAATSYTFIARASDLFGNEEKNTASVSLVTLAGVSPLFAGLQSAMALEGIAGLSGVELRWSEADNATHYRIYRYMGVSARGEEFNFDFEACKLSWDRAAEPGCKEIEAPGVSAFEATGLIKNTQYSFIVRAVSKVDDLVTGEEQNRVIKIVTTNDEKAPTFIGASSVAPAGGPAGANTMQLKWAAPSRDGVYDGFTVLYKPVAETATSFSIPTGADISVTLVDIPNALARDTEISGLTYNQRYCFTVRTRYSPNSAIRSEPTSAGFACGKPVPQPPEFGGVKTRVFKGDGPLGFSQLKVEWEQASGSFSAYEVSWSVVNNYVNDSVVGSFFQDGNRQVITARSITSFTITGLTPNTTYYIRVRARFELTSVTPPVLLMSGGNVVAQATTTPMVPSGDGVLTVKQVGDGEIELRWNAPNNLGLFNRYFIFRGEGLTAETDLISAVAPNNENNPPYTGEVFLRVGNVENDPAFLDRVVIDSENIKPNTRYCYLVKAVYFGAEGFVGSANTDKACVDARINPPEFLGLVSAKAPTSISGFNSLNLQWVPAKGNFTAYQYRIGELPDALGEWTNLSGGIDTKSATIDGLSPNTLYYISVRAVYRKVFTDQTIAEFSAGENVILSGRSTPKAPVHAGLQPVKFLPAVGEVELSWDAPQADPEVGGLYDGFLLWRMVGNPADIFDEINAMMTDVTTPGYISDEEVNNAAYHVSKVEKTATKVTFQGANALEANVQTCFLVRASYGGANEKFLMSLNQIVRCVTPTASAPQFSGLASLTNIPNSSNGFSQLQANWQLAEGLFTRYELVLSQVQDVNTWSTLAFSSTDPTVLGALLSNMDGFNLSAGTKLQPFRRYFARMRAVYEATNGAIFFSGDSVELSAVVSPDQPSNDGLIDVSTDKVPGLPPLAQLNINGSVDGLWDRVAIFRSSHPDQSTASAAVISQALAKADMSGFVGTPIGFVNRKTPTDRSDLSFTDNSVSLGQWNCYIARAAYMSSSWFLTSTAAQLPICKQPAFLPVSFSGVAIDGSEICQDQSDGEICDPATRWPNTGNSRVRLKLMSVPMGDIDYFDVYMGSSPVYQDLLAQGVFQSFPKADPIHDPNPNDEFLYVGGASKSVIPGGQYYFLVRARCLGCTYTDTNTNVSNPVQTLSSYVRASVNFLQPDFNLNYSEDTVAGGRFEDPARNIGLFSSDGWANLNGGNDYLKATNPGMFAPKTGRTFAVRFNLNDAPSTDKQNKDGSAVFALDSAVRPPFVDVYDQNNVATDVNVEGNLFGIPGSVTVFDQRGGRCLWMGGYAGQSSDQGDIPLRDQVNNWVVYRRANAQRMQAFDGQNFYEIYSRGPSPLPRSLPVVAYHPGRQTVILFGGLTTGGNFVESSSPQRLAADTWEWDGRRWSLLSAGPTSDQWADNELGRYGSNIMAMNPFNGNMVMVGGRYAIPDGMTALTPLSSSVNWWDLRQILLYGSGFPATTLSVDRYNKVRRAMHTLTNDPTTGVYKWEGASLPPSFPVGYPAALVSVPDGTAKGLYYFSFRNSSADTMVANDVWFYDGSWSVIQSSALVGGAANAQLYAFYDPVLRRIFLTFGRGNAVSGKKVWEYDPANRSKGQAAWLLRTPSYSPPTFSNMPCFDPQRRVLVEYGGQPVDSWNALNSPTLRERTPQDIFQYNPSADSWTRAPVAYDRSSSHGDFFGLYPKLGGIFSHGGFIAYSNYWEGFTNSLASWLFKDGFWQRMLQTDTSRKYSSSAGYGSMPAVAFRNPQIVNTGSSNETLVVAEASAWNEKTTINLQDFFWKGRPKQVRSFDGSGWRVESVDASGIPVPVERCPTLKSVDQYAEWTMYPHGGMGFNQVQTPWGTLLKGPPFSGNLTYENGAASPDCRTSAARTWRYTDSPFIFLNKETDPTSGVSTWKARELKTSGSSLDPFRFCDSVGLDANNPAVDNAYKRWPTKMVWDDFNRRILLLGYDDSGKTVYMRRVQALKMRNESVASQRCFYVEDLNAPINQQPSWSSFNAQLYWGSNASTYDKPLFDPARGRVLVLSNVWTSNAICGGGCSGNSDGFVWELNVNSAPYSWTLRSLPEAYRRLPVMSGNMHHFVTPYPGGTSEWLLHSTATVHGWGQRNIPDNYILKVTDSEISLRPALPRFGVTLGADGKSGFISVPGDKGEPMSNTVGGSVVYSGRRKFTDNLLGNRTLFITFNSDKTYSVYLDNMNTPVIPSATWDAELGGVYAGDFFLGARYATWYRFGDSTLRRFTSAGNTNVSFDWLKVFDKSLTAQERSYWSTLPAEEQ